MSVAGVSPFLCLQGVIFMLQPKRLCASEFPDSTDWGFCLAFTAMSNTLVFRLIGHHVPALPLSLWWSPYFSLHKFNFRLPVCWSSLYICQQRPTNKMMDVIGIRSTKNLMLRLQSKVTTWAENWTHQRILLWQKFHNLFVAYTGSGSRVQIASVQIRKTIAV